MCPPSKANKIIVTFKCNYFRELITYCNFLSVSCTSDCIHHSTVWKME